MAVPKKIDLPSDSPFFGKETEQQAVKRLSGIYLDQLKNAKPTGTAAKLDAALTALIKAKAADRAPMGIGIAIRSGGSPYFVGAHYDRIYSVHSIAKLALLYAVFQLRADLAVIGNTAGLAADSPYDYTSRVADLIQGTRQAFTKANDSALRDIGGSTGNFPKLARIFNLEDYLKADPPYRSPSTLQFATSTNEVTNADDLPFTTRLTLAVSSSDNPNDASCICDIGLPYIQALLRRSGFATLHGPRRPGLWLSWYYQTPTQVDKIQQGRRTRAGKSLPTWLRDLPINQRDAITTPFGGGLISPDPNLERKTVDGPSGHVGTAVGIATFLTQLDSEQLVDADACKEMLTYLPRSRWMAKKFRGLGNGMFHSKVGFTPPHYCDCVLSESQAIQQAATPKPAGSADAGTPDAGSASAANRSVKWIAVGLDALGSSDQAKMAAYDDNDILEELGAAMETAVADNV